MKLEQAMRIIHGTEGPEVYGYRVHYEAKIGNLLAGRMFPEANEPAIVTEVEAWRLARLFAAKTVGTHVNIYVIYACNYDPVPGYETQRIDNYPQTEGSS